MPVARIAFPVAASNPIPMSIAEYLRAVEQAHKRDDATEHTYRPDLKALLESLGDVLATNEPKREKCGAPDYEISRRKDA